MGKNKWFFETDGVAGSNIRHTDYGTGGRPKKGVNLPSAYQTQKASGTGAPLFLSSFSFKNLKRKWLSLKHKGQSVASPVFSKSTLAKFAILAVASYYIFGSRADISASLAGSAVQVNWHEETKLGVGAEKKKPAPAVKKTKKPPKSDAAPVSTEQLRGDQSSNYIKRFSGIARDEMRKYGVPASISLAQGLIESRAGTSKLAVNNNNHFGMKCFSRNCRKGHCTNFTDDTHKDFFLKFENATQSWNAHSKLLASGRYAKLKKHGRDYRRWALGLKSVGYATDRTYAQKLIGIIERYKLYQYDR